MLSKKIKLLILDIDGVLTDGKKTYDCNGRVLSKNFCDKDWTSIKRFKSVGVEVIFLSGDEFNKIIAEKRGVDIIINKENGVMVEKSEYLPFILSKYNVSIDDVAYCGDDLYDIGILESVPIRFCPSDSPEAVKSKCCVLDGPGGDNLIQELFELFEIRGLIDKKNYSDIKSNMYKLDR